MTTSTSRRALDSYETALLNELRREVLLRSQQIPLDRPAPVQTSQARRSRRWIPLAAAGVLGATAVVTLPGVLGATPAYALDPHPDGSLTVTINRPEAAGDLSAALARAGFTAQVDYVPRGFSCDGSRFTPASAASGPGGGEVSSAGGHPRFTLRPQQAAAGQTVVIELSGDDRGGTVSVAMAAGPVGACAAYRLLTPAPSTGPGSGGEQVPSTWPSDVPSETSSPATDTPNAETPAPTATSPTPR